MGILSQIRVKRNTSVPDDTPVRFRALAGDRVIADSDTTIVVEGNRYFPRKDVDPTVLESNPMQTTCPWKGQASYHDIVVQGKRRTGAAWYYAEPKAKAAHIADHVAFDRSIDIVAVAE